MSKFIVILFAFLLFIHTESFGQLAIGKSGSNINFRSGPGLDYSISHTIDSSNLLVILPTEEKNGFVEAFDVETNTLGFVYKKLLKLSDSLPIQKQHFVQIEDQNSTEEVTLILTNRTAKSIFVWLNGVSYILQPREKENLVFEERSITYFASSPGMFPIYGKEELKSGESYYWEFE